MYSIAANLAVPTASTCEAGGCRSGHPQPCGVLLMGPGRDPAAQRAAGALNVIPEPGTALSSSGPDISERSGHHGAKVAALLPRDSEIRAALPVGTAAALRSSNFWAVPPAPHAAYNSAHQVPKVSWRARQRRAATSQHLKFRADPPCTACSSGAGGVSFFIV